MHAICDDSTTVRRIGGLWYATFNKDFCRTLNDSKLYATLNINSHHGAPQRASVASLSHAKTAEMIVPEIGLGPPRNIDGHSEALSFVEMFIIVQGYCKWDVRQEFNLSIQYQNSDLD